MLEYELNNINQELLVEQDKNQKMSDEIYRLSQKLSKANSTIENYEKQTQKRQQKENCHQYLNRLTQFDSKERGPQN